MMLARIALLALVLFIAVQGVNPIRGQEVTTVHSQLQLTTTNSPQPQSGVGEEFRDVENKEPDPFTSFFHGLFFIAWAFGMLPTIIAFARGHTHKIALGFLNFIVCLIGAIPFIGWLPAILGWIATFIWAAAGETWKQAQRRYN